MVQSVELVRRLGRATLAQAARVAEQLAWRRGRRGEVGRDMVPAEEPVRFAASERLHLIANDIADVEVGEHQVRITANVMGLAGATPALPAPYSELQLQRRRARDFSFSRFLNVFDHRALSFFYRITRKYRWPLLVERSGPGGGEDPVRDFLVTMAGLSVPGTMGRLDVEDAALAPLVASFADLRRSARNVETILREMTRLPLRVVEAWPVWMAVPAGEQSRLGRHYARLGNDPRDAGPGLGEAALIGSTVLDVQHHYVVEIGPLAYDQLHEFCFSAEARRQVSQLCLLSAGIEQRPMLRLLVATADIPPLRLGAQATGAMLGRTTWLGVPETVDGIASDCTIPVSVGALGS